MAWFLQVAIEHAFTVLSWYEHRAEDEVPPEYLWEDPEGLDLWWQKIADRDGQSSGAGGSADGGSPQDMVTNELAAEFKR